MGQYTLILIISLSNNNGKASIRVDTVYSTFRNKGTCVTFYFIIYYAVKLGVRVKFPSNML